MANGTGNGIANGAATGTSTSNMSEEDEEQRYDASNVTLRPKSPLKASPEERSKEL